jgi:hypothetical protein
VLIEASVCWVSLQIFTWKHPRPSTYVQSLQKLRGISNHKYRLIVCRLYLHEQLDSVNNIFHTFCGLVVFTRIQCNLQISWISDLWIRKLYQYTVGFPCLPFWGFTFSKMSCAWHICILKINNHMYASIYILNNVTNYLNIY